MKTAITVGAERIELSPGSKVILGHRSWADYESLLESRLDGAAVKIRFNADTQEISLMAPLAGHGSSGQNPAAPARR